MANAEDKAGPVLAVLELIFWLRRKNAPMKTDASDESNGGKVVIGGEGRGGAVCGQG